MRTLLLAAVLWLLAVLCSAASVVRTYPDGLQTLSDSVVLLTPPDSCLIPLAVEARASVAHGNAFGVAWKSDAESALYCATLAPVDDSKGDDIIADRYLLLSIFRRTDSADSLLLSLKLTKHVDCTSGGSNSIAAEFDHTRNQICIYAGDRDMLPLARLPLHPGFRGSLGVMAAGTVPFSIVVAEYQPDLCLRHATSWTEESLSTYFSTVSPQSPEGFWHYLDRSYDSRYSRPGGDYRLAVVASSAGAYDIIYLSGALTCADTWKPGMLKGRLEPTGFVGHYNLIWYDASFTPHSRDCSATLEHGSVLRFDLPLLKTSMRYSKSRQGR